MLRYTHEEGDLVTLDRGLPMGDRALFIVTGQLTALDGRAVYTVDFSPLRVFEWRELEPVDDEKRRLWLSACRGTDALVGTSRIALIEEQIHTASMRHEGWVQLSQAATELRFGADELGDPALKRKLRSTERKARALRRLLK